MSRVEKYSYVEFCSDIDLITEQIKNDKDWQPDYIVGLVRGGAIPAVFLSHKLDVPVIMIHWSERDNKELNNIYNTHEWIAQEINSGKKILIVDDIIDSGISIKNVTDYWQQHLTKKLNFDNVRVASLIYNISQMNAIAQYYASSIDRKFEHHWFEFFWESND